MNKLELENNITAFLEKKPISIAHKDLSKEALKCLGDLNPYVRDDLIYTYLESVIQSNQLLDEEIEEILDQCLLNIFDFSNDDMVFLRTFSLLVIACIIEKHNLSPFIVPCKLEEVINKVILSYITDRDVRGYVQGKGWAHGAAHGADVFFQFAKLKLISSENLIKILNAVKEKVSINYYGYVHNEDGRMAKACIEVIERNQLDQKDIIDWIDSFSIDSKFSVENLIKKINIRNFLRSLYFKLLKKNQYIDIINHLLIKLDRYH